MDIRACAYSLVAGIVEGNPDAAVDEDVDYIAVPDSDALEQVWIGDHWPPNAGKFESASAGA